MFADEVRKAVGRENDFAADHKLAHFLQRRCDWRLAQITGESQTFPYSDRADAAQHYRFGSNCIAAGSAKWLGCTRRR